MWSSTMLKILIPFLQDGTNKGLRALLNSVKYIIVSYNGRVNKITLPYCKHSHYLFQFQWQNWHSEELIAFRFVSPSSLCWPQDPISVTSNTSCIEQWSHLLALSWLLLNKKTGTTNQPTHRIQPLPCYLLKQWWYLEQATSHQWLHQMMQLTTQMITSAAQSHRDQNRCYWHSTSNELFQGEWWRRYKAVVLRNILSLALLKNFHNSAMDQKPQNTWKLNAFGMSGFN